MRVKVKKNHNPINERFTIYDCINSIPFELQLDNYEMGSGIIYARNLNDGNFIEFNFVKKSKILFGILLVSVNKENVESVDYTPLFPKDDNLYLCYIDGRVPINTSAPTKILKGNSFIQIYWSENVSQIKYYRISEKCSIGLNDNNYLESVVIESIDKETIHTIFGY
ncbi:hypothetical protein AMR72_09380 [Flavobacterium psychrophilum]|nr:hypothetical protein AMR72_09380 [Flavobacterium psychrophilum]AOE52698.1 hypothetical protein ALW18_09370 [Flavobacterium psychrophilum]